MGDRKLSHLEVSGSEECIIAAADWAEARAVALALESHSVFAVRLCMEEAVTNLVRHAYDDEPSRHVIALDAWSSDDATIFTITDDGRAFDPVTADDPGREGTILDASVGGRGLRLMRRFTKSMRYSRKNGLNCLSLVF